MKRTHHWLIAIGLGLALLTTAGAHASNITFIYSGTVDACPDTGFPPCGDILFVGDDVSGPYVLPAESVEPGSDANFDEFISFSTMVGAFFAVSSDNSSLTGGGVKFDHRGEITGGVLVILATALPDAPPTRVTLDISNGTWRADALVPEPVFIAGGTGGFKRVPEIPLPAAVWMFVPALAGLGMLRRRRQG